MLKKVTYFFLLSFLLLLFNHAFREKVISTLSTQFISHGISSSTALLEDHTSVTLWATHLPLSSFYQSSCQESAADHQAGDSLLKKQPKPLVEGMSIYYPWKSFSGPLSPITKDYFRCRGSSLNPPIPILQDGKIVNNIFDCGGADSHSLPLRYDNEFIYPILLELLNTLQRTIGKSVIITSGHRCPIHNRYVDSSIKNSLSKHTIGAEVNFYIQGMEREPHLIIACIEEFYKNHPRYGNDRKDYSPLIRYEKETDVSTKPWMNKEVFIKYYLPHEGRNGDNRHPFPYFSIQVRFDRERQLKVTVSPQDIERYLRY